MYLMMLNEKQKHLFFELAYHLAAIDGNYSKEEALMMESYRCEMQIGVIPQGESRQSQNIISDMQSTCGEREKRIIVFESIGLAMADNIYNESEKALIQSLIASFNIEKSFAQKCEKGLHEYIEFQNKLNKLIMG